MSDGGQIESDDTPVEVVLREELAHGDVVLGSTVPILSHLMANSDNTLFGDEIIARVRGMARNVAEQLLMAQFESEAVWPGKAAAQRMQEQLAAELLAKSTFLSHCHALALEAQLTLRLQERNAIDPVLTPLMQALVGSDDSTCSGLAMATLSAQARFMQWQRRMELPLRELPGDLFHMAILTWRAHAQDLEDNVAEAAESRLRGHFDEAHGRIGLLSRLVSTMGNGAMAALSFEHAGVGLGLTALAQGSNQNRDLAVFSTNERLLGRLALGLRAAGLKTQEIEKEFFLIHPDIALPPGFDNLRRGKASEILATSNNGKVG